MAEAYVIPPSIALPGNEDPIASGIFGIRIDMSTQDPNGAVVYTDDATGMEPLACDPVSGTCSYGDWKDVIEQLIGCKPCLYKNGARVKYLNPDNYASDVDGAGVDITSGNSGDVMIEFKHLWYQMRRSGNYLYFKITGNDMSGDSDWTDIAFASENGGSIQDYFYYSAYEGYVSGSTMLSVSGKSPTVNINIVNARSYATSKGSKYSQLDLCKHEYITALTWLVTKGRDLQTTIGMGVTSASAKINTGTMNSKGLFYGTNSGTVGVKVFGIENFFGNIYKWCEGIISNSGANAKIKLHGPYGESRNDYVSITGLSTNSGCIQTLDVFQDGLLLPIAANGSNYEIYFADYWYLHSGAGYVCFLGGDWSAGRYAGPLYLTVSNSASNADTDIGCRLVAA